jgi:hypothetical protein
LYIVPVRRSFNSGKILYSRPEPEILDAFISWMAGAPRVINRHDGIQPGHARIIGDNAVFDILHRTLAKKLPDTFRHANLGLQTDYDMAIAQENLRDALNRIQRFEPVQL